MSASKPRSSGIPTPGRLRSYSSSAATHPPVPIDPEVANKAFADAIKANDPTRHSIRSVSANNPVQRPPSAAARSRPKTPSGPFGRNSQQRPQSRQSEGFTRVKSEFQVGDNVRIESLGFEGTLRYVGEIKGKSGEWAGVELTGGFTGLGKNSGSVGTDHYFSCPDKCGVFVAYNKLSPPATRSASYSRPSSVASSRASLPGRITPSYIGRAASSVHNGRVTPSTPASNGRVTPAQSNGRLTPSSSSGFSFSMSSSMTRTTQRPTILPPSSSTSIVPSTSAMSKITAGSRASKYVGMTAQQLSARSQKTMVPSSPSRASLGLGSPTRLQGPPSPSRSDSRSPSGGTPKPNTRLSFGTPKSFGSGRPSLTTPKPRVPSAVAMPPPPSPPPSGFLGRSISLNDKPTTPTLSTTNNDTAVDEEGIESLASIQSNSRALKDKIQSLLLSNSSAAQRIESPSQSFLTDVFRSDAVVVEPSEVNASVRVMQEHVGRLEQENAQLKVDLEEARATSTNSSEINELRTEHELSLDRLQTLESQLRLAERSLDERNSKVELLERSVQESAVDIQTLRAEGESRANDLQTKFYDSQSLITSLKEAVEAKSNEAGQSEGIIQAKDAEISLLEARVKKASSDLDDVRRDLSGQIDELRHAGQETIALYEERLATADSKRYQLEDLVDRLEERMKRRGSLTLSKSGADQDLAEATRIDNEALREQVIHLQNKISSLEDLLEEARGNMEKEESASSSRIQRYKDSEASLRSELAETRNELERLSKNESLARAKAEEAEEALRENKITLDNAQADIEGMRVEIASLESLQARNSSERLRSEDSSRTVASERDRHNEETAQLKEMLEAARAARKDAMQELDAVKAELLATSNSLSHLKETVDNLDLDKSELEQSQSELSAKLERERLLVAELQKALENKTSELEFSRKTNNRDRPINVGLQEMSASSAHSKQDSNSYREEIKGLKHIVQELQKETSTLSARNKMLESENKMLMKETDSLRQELKFLEDNVEQDLLEEERSLSSEGDQPPPPNGEAHMKARNKAEVERLRKQLAEHEKKSTRTIHELNQEVNELESLIEAKIYREDELEREIERLRQKSSKSHRPSKSSVELPVTENHRHHHSSTSSTGTINGSETSRHSTTAKSTASDSLSTQGSSALAQESEVCEICEQQGHDIFTCPLLKDGSEAAPAGPSLGGVRRGSDPVQTDLFCEDCEGQGHLAADCPYSSDIF